MWTKLWPKKKLKPVFCHNLCWDRDAHLHSPSSHRTFLLFLQTCWKGTATMSFSRCVQADLEAKNSGGYKKTCRWNFANKSELNIHSDSLMPSKCVQKWKLIIISFRCQTQNVRLKSDTVNAPPSPLSLSEWRFFYSSCSRVISFSAGGTHLYQVISIWQIFIYQVQSEYTHLKRSHSSWFF